MNILCIETSASLCSVAVFKDEEIFFSEDTKSMAHAEVLMDLIKTCVNKAGIKMGDLNAIALSGGPGSYTGLRIGCSTAKGICYALKIPLIVIDTLKITAFVARKKEDSHAYYWAMIDARRMEVYHAVYDNDLQRIGEMQSGIITDMHFAPDMVNNNNTLICGDGAAKASPVLNIADAKVVANASAMCELARNAYLNNEFEDVAYYEPFYLKQANITVSKS